LSAQNALNVWRLRRKKNLFAKHLGGLLSTYLGKANVCYLTDSVVYMMAPNDSSRASGNRQYLYIPGSGWINQCPLTAGSMAATGEITGGSQSVYTSNTVESFSIIWNNSGLPVVAFSIGFNRALTAAERTALSSTVFWAAILPVAINTANCTALYPFLPPDVQNLVGFWDASAITGLANDDPCGSWADRSGLGNTVAQTGAASLKPTYKTNQQNGLPALSFDGGDNLSCDAVAAYFTGEDKPGSCIAVVKRAVTNANHWAVTLGPNAPGGVARYFLCAYSSSDAERCERKDDAETNAVQLAALGVSTDAHILSVVYGAQTLSVWANNTNKVNAAASNVGVATLDNFNVGCWLTNTSIQGSHNGLIGEILVFKSALSDADRQRIQSYLSAKWGIALA
jgi:hypothetical protein